MADLTLGSFNLHMGRGSGGHDAPFYDVVTACKEIDTDVLVLQEAWVPDGEDGDVLAIAAALGYEVAATFSVARAECHDQVRLVARSGDAGDGDWQLAVLSRLPVVGARVVPLEPQLPRDPGRRAVLVVTVEVGGRPFTVCGTHLPLLKDPVWRLAPSLRRALPPPDRPAALAGDMNMWGWCAERLVGGGAGRWGRRSWRRAVRGRTYPAHRPHSQTDHILVTRPAQVVDAEVVPRVRSDHRPIRARLRV
ncbi:MAG TPA: endonuclease/exonuclease/phosphatase family protein [Acidimicrobiales bacterium]|nr:endonuclease/exonuclease/phosphatase family protein [Acidimicrobiales bacterium]